MNYIGHCNECEYALFAESNVITQGDDWRKLYAGEARRVMPYGGVYGRCPKGHKAFRLFEVKGKFNPDHKCDDRCLNAKGHDCTCSCGGANHGRGHAAEFVQAALPDSKPISDLLTDKQQSFILKLIDEREMSEDARDVALSRVETLTKAQASAWIEKLLTLSKIGAKV